MNGPSSINLFDEVEPRPDNFGDRATRRMLVYATLILWSANFAILTVKSIAERSGTWAELLAPRLFLTAIGIGLCIILHLLLRQASRWGFRWQLAVAAALAVLAAEAYGWLNAAVARMVFGAIPSLPLGETILQLSLHLWFFATWIGFYLSITYIAKLRAQEGREAKMRILAQAAQLQTLHYQINPHFLFNTLNSISSLVVDGRNDQAEVMLQRLSDYLRSTLELDPGVDVPLDRELALQRSYLGIEQTRFPEMALNIDIADDVRSAWVPSLILHPLVENAVKHGVAKNLGGSAIDISARRSGQIINLEVSNQTSLSANGMELGIGLQNVRDRLAARFGNLAELTTEHLTPGLFKVKISFPLVVAQ
jgi:two-component system, LytTR family, sensor kinase